MNQKEDKTPTCRQSATGSAKREENEDRGNSIGLERLLSLTYTASSSSPNVSAVGLFKCSHELMDERLYLVRAYVN